jgi:hypothetical protein
MDLQLLARHTVDEDGHHCFAVALLFGQNSATRCQYAHR